MITFETITDARNAIMDFRADFFSAVPDYLKARFRELTASPSPVDQIVGVGEFVYANREALSNEARDLGAGLIGYATTNAWHGLLEDDRGNKIVANLRKLTGEIKNAPEAPEPRPGSFIEDPAHPVDTGPSLTPDA
jgi:hypothetical protein